METKIENKKVVEEFFMAINEGDMQTAMSYFSADHEYVGPMFSSKGPDEYLKNLMDFEMEFKVDSHDLIAAENHVIHVATLKIIQPVQAEIPTCEVFDVENGKITRQRFFFDTKLFPSHK